jgi:sulfite reductase alpha subunit-like flavoprotein
VVSNFTTPIGRIHKGICTNWLAGKREGDLLPCFLRTSTFRMPKDPATPVIMIGPGTGLAPFRGFLQERQTSKLFFLFFFVSVVFRNFINFF